MKRRIAVQMIAIVASCALSASGSLAQFSTPSMQSWTNAAPARPAPTSDLARQQREWAMAATHQAIKKVNLLPRTAVVDNRVQQAVTNYAPGGANGWARNWDASDCETSIRNAEAKYGLPPYLLAAIALTESGQNGRPSPFAMNIGGHPFFADSTDQMIDVVEKNGGEQSSIDVGCTQVNLRWHAGRFKDWRSLLVPNYNAGYAALYLRELYRQKGSWNAAVGAYHSNTPWKSANYACLVSRRWSQMFGSNRPGCGADIEAMSRLMYSTQGRG